MNASIAATVVVSGSEHRVVVRSRLWDRLDDIPVLNHFAVFASVNVNDGSAARTLRQAVPVAVEDDVIRVREDPLAMRAWTIGRIQATNFQSPSMPSPMRGLCWR
jgi:hypothetical protein